MVWNQNSWGDKEIQTAQQQLCPAGQPHVDTTFMASFSQSLFHFYYSLLSQSLLIFFPKGFFLCGLSYIFYLLFHFIIDATHGFYVTLGLLCVIHIQTPRRRLCSYGQFTELNREFLLVIVLKSDLFTETHSFHVQPIDICILLSISGSISFGYSCRIMKMKNISDS